MRRVMSVGQCGIDHGAIVRFLKKNFDVEITPVATEREAKGLLQRQPFDLILVNRQFDADGTEGVDFIARLKSQSNPETAPVMMITNFPEYAEEAETAGAVPGFGKAQLGSPELVEHLTPYLKSEKTV